MKKFLILAIMLIASNTLFAQATVENSATFTGVSAKGNIELNLVKGDDTGFKAEISGVGEDRFDWSVENGVLSLTLRSPLRVGKNSNVVASATITVTYQTLNSVAAANDAKILSEENIESNNIEFSVVNKGVISLEVTAKDVRVDGTNGVATISGTTEYVTIKGNTGASVNCSNLNAKVATVSSGTNAECYVSVSEKIDAKATSNSSIFYKGEPEIVNSDTNTLGTVQKY